MLKNQALDLSLSLNGIELQTLKSQHLPALEEIAQDQAIWKFNPAFTHPAEFKSKWFDKAMRNMQTGDRLVFYISKNGQAIGSSSFYEIDASNKRLTIGYTWFHSSHWKTGVNRIAKYLMLKHAFETLQYNRVAFAIDSENISSCTAVEKLGAKKEGILRNHIIRPNGTLRHTVYYSIIKEEWPSIKQFLNLNSAVGS